MLVLCSLIDIEVVQQTTTEGTFGQHALHGMTQHTLYAERLLAELGRSIEALTARIARKLESKGFSKGDIFRVLDRVRREAKEDPGENGW